MNKNYVLFKFHREHGIVVVTVLVLNQLMRLEVSKSVSSRRFHHLDWEKALLNVLINDNVKHTRVTRLKSAISRKHGNGRL